MDFTESTEEYELLLYGGLSPASAARHLLDEHLVLRTFPQVLRELYPADDVQFRLTTAFAAGQEDKMASAARKVRNWLSGKNAPTNREDIFRIAFALDLDEDQCGELLGFCTEYGIHYRDGRELIYAWFLRMGFGYSDAVEQTQRARRDPVYGGTYSQDARRSGVCRACVDPSGRQFVQRIPVLPLLISL